MDIMLGEANIYYLFLSILNEYLKNKGALNQESFKI
jgi:hypothetical protein